MDAEDDPRTIGRRVRQIRQARRKSLRVVAGLAGISASHLSRIETNVPDMMQLAGFLALRRSIIAAAAGRPGDVDASIEYATDLAERTGEGNTYGLGFGPIKVGLYRMSGLLEIGDNERAASVAESSTRKRTSTGQVKPPTGPTTAAR